MQEKNLQWHPAFYADLQIELQEDRENLIFENEHLLGTKPTQIDVLVVKKEKNIPVKKNIGRIFKQHNVIEYKGPTDYLNVDDFYKGYAYACFYKSQTERVNEIDITDITITFVCKNYPGTLIEHLEAVKKLEVNRIESGIYYVNGDSISMQIIVIKELSKTENLWLRNLTNDIASEQETEKLIQEYMKHKNNKLYESVMDVIVRANEMQFKGGNNMCRALEELVEELMEEKMKEKVEALKREMKPQMEQELSQKISNDKDRTFVRNMLLRGISDEDIRAVAECNQELIDNVRMQLR